MSDRAIVAMAAATFGAALTPMPIPIWLATAAFAVALAWQRPVVMVVTVALLCSCLAWRSWQGLQVREPQSVSGVASVVTDPLRQGGRTSVVVRLDGRRLVGRAYGGAGARLSQANAGDTAELRGRTAPYRGSRERRAALHAAETVTITEAQVRPARHPVWRIANSLRDKIESGAASLDNNERSLFTGLVYGDDRGQAPLTELDFRLAGLTHLLAVSGQNVAYTLVVLRPLIERRSLAARWVATTGVLVIFATATRFEPSVLRATVMAGIAVTAKATGRDAPTGRLLALAITLLLLVDPLLAETIAFRLSVAASGGIVALGPRIEAGLRGPRLVRETLAVTLSAQLAVAPLLVTTFGPVSVVSIPANVVAGPAAGFVMGWGMTAGLLAGLTPQPISAALHQVTSTALWALQTTARVAAEAPLASVGIGWIVAATALASARRWWLRSMVGRTAAAIVGVGLAVSLIPRTPPGTHDVGFGSRLSTNPQTTVLMLGRESNPVTLLEDLHRLSVRDIDVVVMRSGASSAVLAVIEQRVPVGEVTPAQ